MLNFLIFFYSQFVLFKFSQGPQVLNVFPPDVPNSTTLALPKGHLFTYIGGPKGTPSSKRKFHFGEPSKCFFGWVMGQSKWLIAKKKVQLVRHPHLLNIRMYNKCLRMNGKPLWRQVL